MIRAIDHADLPAAMAFNDTVYRKHTSLLQPDFFTWQFDESGGQDNAGNNGTFLSTGRDRVDGICLAAHYDINFGGDVKSGTWLHYWFTAPNSGPCGLLMLRRLIQGTAFFGGAAMDLQAASVLHALQIPMVWFEVDRLIAVFDPVATCDLSFARSHHTLSYLKALRVPEPSASVQALPIVRFDESYDELWTSLRPRYRLCTDRTSRFMNWRYIDHPRFEYKCLSCTGPSGSVVYVWREETIQGSSRIVCRICDVIGEPQAIRETYANCHYEMSRQPKVVFADFLCSHSHTNASLVGGGMVPAVTRSEIDLPVRFQPIERQASPRIDFYILFPQTPPADFFDYPSMYFTKGDSNQDRPL